jgi:RHS repeat-associated protein
MIQQNSSDGTIAYNYAYDLHDNLIQIEDAVCHADQKRSFDVFNCLISEEISPGLLIEYSYDSIDRLTKVKFPDNSFAAYTYDLFHLKKVERCAASGELSYSYDCLEYDKMGRLLKGNSPAGTTNYVYDLLGRAIKIETPHWKECLESFDAAGNLLKIFQRDGLGDFSEEFSYDSFNHLVSEATNRYNYDSIGNCLQKNGAGYQIGLSNQLTSDGESNYSYDLNGNLIEQINPPARYFYDGLNRLVRCENQQGVTCFTYDAFGRCLEISDATGTRRLIYQKDQEIGAYLNGELQELRFVHPNSDNEQVFAIELQGNAYFPTQDHRYNISSLQAKDGSLAEWYRYSAFGSTTSFGEQLNNPWRFANRREVAGLTLFTHRLYNPNLMRWQTTDPLGFADGLNLYTYVHNNPHYYRDPNGQFAFVIPLFSFAFGGGALAFALPSTATLLNIGTCALLGYSAYKIGQQFDINCLYESDYYQYMMNQVEGEAEKKEKQWEKEEPRTEPRDLPEQLTLGEAQAGAGKEIMKDKIKDSRYPQEEWEKKAYVHRRPNDATKASEGKIEIHYWENKLTGKRHGFKFKNP